jgi:dTDP-4-dehydrorhamnose 3,5-epimerase
MPFQFQHLSIPDVVLIRTRRYADNRGFFLETYKRSEFAAHGIAESFVQDNQSRSMHGVLRGLHYQNPPRAQGKLVRVLRGEVFDVAVDIRRGSPTFAQWIGVRLSGERFEMLYIPPGFAHGFCALSDVVDFAYKVTAEYAPHLDAGIVWNDPQIGIAWPAADPVLSSRDAGLPTLARADLRFVYPGHQG